MSAKKTIKKVLSVLGGIVVAVVFAIPYIFFREQIQDMAVLGYIGLAVACLISNISIFLPSSSTIIVLVAATTLNPWLCILFGGIGTAFGEQASYLCGVIGSSGFSKDEPVQKKVVLNWFSNKPFLTVFLFAFVPLPVFDIVGIVAGTKKMKWWKYTLAAVFGKTLKFLMAVVLVHYILPRFVEFIPGPGGDMITFFLKEIGIY